MEIKEINMEDKFNLERFIQAQSTNYDIALNEIKNGRKSSHWMWYIFPQFKGLGRSETSKHYAIINKEEAISYYNHSILGNRLKEITLKFLTIENKSANEILGSPDHYKMKSCMSLFHLIQNDTDIFFKVLEKHYQGKICESTKKKLELE